MKRKRKRNADRFPEDFAFRLTTEEAAYPVLAYFRSQHDNESWLAALTAILDTCALVIACPERACRRQAELTFAMARHAVVDLSLVFRTGPREPTHNRLPPEALAELRATLATAGIKLHEGETADRTLSELRAMYEPYIHALATYFQVSIPPWVAAERRLDNWQGSIQEPRSAARNEPRARVKGEHF